MRSTKSAGMVLLAMLMIAVLPAGVRAAEARFEGEIRAFEAADRQHHPPRNAVLFVGSSSVRFWASLAKDFAGVTTIRRGFGGSEIADSTRYAERIVIPYRPRQIVMYAGDNDIAAGRSPEQVAADFRQFVRKVQVALPDVRISYISIKPSIARWKLVDRIKEANRRIEGLVRQDKHLDYIDVFTPMLNSAGNPRPELFRPDGLHLNPDGYALWTRLVRPHLTAEPSVSGAPRTARTAGPNHPG